MRGPAGTWTACVATLLALAVLVASARQLQDASARYAKRDEVAEPVRGGSLVWSGRAGRSGNRADVALRNDRFFLGSRYGKRSDILGEQGADELEVDGPLTCLYTGITNLYRCFDRKDNASGDFPAQSN